MTGHDFRLSLLVDRHDLDPDELAQVEADDYEDELAADIARDGGWS